MINDQHQIEDSYDYSLVGFLIDVPPMVSMVVQPVFERVGENEKRNYIQVVDDENYVTGFRPVTIDKIADLIEYKGTLTRISISSEAIYAYHFPEMIVEHGTKEHVDGIVSAALEKISQNKHSLHEALVFLGRRNEALKIFENEPAEQYPELGNPVMPKNRSERFDRIEQSIRASIEQYGLNGSGVKLEDFDFSELTSDLTNSVTDALYREFLPPLKSLHEEQIESGRDTNHRNMLDVDDIVDSIKSELQEHVKERVLISARTKIKSELEEQYIATSDSIERAQMLRVSNIRNLLIPMFYGSAFVLFSVVFLSLLSAADLVISVATAAFTQWSSCASGSCQFNPADILIKISGFLQILLFGVIVILITVGSYQNSVSKISRRHDLPSWFSSLALFDMVSYTIFLSIGISAIDVLTKTLSGPNTEIENLSVLEQGTVNSLLVLGGLIFAAFATAYCRILFSHGQRQSDVRSVDAVIAKRKD